MMVSRTFDQAIPSAVSGGFDALSSPTTEVLIWSMPPEHDVLDGGVSGAADSRAGDVKLPFC
jgi:hypothetical protein